MPKVVDHRQRKQLIADALLALAAREGLQGVSLRHVAEEAGVTAGMVQHYFASKDEMMRFAMTAASERYERRVGERVARLGDNPGPAALVTAVLGGLIPRSEPERADARVALAFQAYASTHPEASAELTAANAHLHTFVGEQLAGAAASVSPEAANVLIGAAEGLALHVLSAGLSPDDAFAALDRAVRWALDAGQVPARS